MDIRNYLGPLLFTVLLAASAAPLAGCEDDAGALDGGMLDAQATVDARVASDAEPGRDRDAGSTNADAAGTHDADPINADAEPINADAEPINADADTSDGDLPDVQQANDGGLHLDAGSCASDNDCVSGQQWCTAGACVPCDNSGLVCRIICPFAWSRYNRNACSPCDCAPVNDCLADSDCTMSGANPKCYAGAFCWDWCPPGDPSCCFGNTCDVAGCTDPNPAGCSITGCPAGKECTLMNTCGTSGCSCDSSSNTWSCLPDCGGGACI